MAIVVGSGEHRYEVIENWGRLPEGWHYGEVAAVGVDSRDNVYVFARCEHPMMVFDRDGNFLRSWGEGLFKRPHGVHIAPDDTIYCTDHGDHTVRRLTLEGKTAAGDRRAGRTGPDVWWRSIQSLHAHGSVARGRHLCRGGLWQCCACTKYSPNGKLQFSWREPGTGPGAFNIMHNICCDEDGFVYRADRENHRVQVFDGKGRYQSQWNNMHRPCGLCMTRGRQPLAYIGESGPGMAVNAKVAWYRAAREHLDA